MATGLRPVGGCVGASFIPSCLHPAGSAGVQEHGPVPQPPGCRAALPGSHGNHTCDTPCFGGVTWRLIILAVGRGCTETGNSPLEEETGALHGPEPGNTMNREGLDLAPDHVDGRQFRGPNLICCHVLLPESISCSSENRGSKAGIGQCLKEGRFRGIWKY